MLAERVLTSPHAVRDEAELAERAAAPALAAAGAQARERRELATVSREKPRGGPQLVVDLILSSFSLLFALAGPIFKMRNDLRVTSVQWWQRKILFDEFAQLFNVPEGDMWLVRPRPMAVRGVQLVDQTWSIRRFSAPTDKPGLWQVSGRSNVGFDDWMPLDLKHIDEWSLGLNLQILARMVPVVLRGMGAA